LDAAHARGLVHRDAKPANVLLARPGEPGEHAYLSDFGLTKRMASAGHTKTGEIVGTVDYMAPEQWRGERVDGRADLYALGAVLFEALTGSVPYVRDSDVAKLYAHLNDEVPVPSAAASEIVTVSANEPANRFFLALARASGGTAGGARAVERVLRRGGDARTRVVAQPPDGARTFTWLGQTRWALRRGAGVYAALQRGDLTGRADTRFVLGLMRRVTGSKWGLRTAVPGSIPLAYKVGVGRDSAGATTAEQYGIVGTGSDASVTAVAARAPDEVSAKAAVDRLAAAATRPVREGGGCGADE
jgi:hypothetical protein